MDLVWMKLAWDKSYDRELKTTFTRYISPESCAGPRLRCLSFYRDGSPSAFRNRTL